jgi:hypothetical protein
MLRAGFGILSANQPSQFPKSALGILGTGGLAGLEGYNNELRNQMAERRTAGLTAVQAMGLKRQLDMEAARKSLFAGTETPMAPVQVALAQGAQAGDVGPTLGNVARLDAAQAPNAAPQYPQIPMDRIRQAMAAGVPIGEALKYNEALEPKTRVENLGNEQVIRDLRTNQIIQRMPMGAAPASVPFEASDITPAEFRAHRLSQATAGAAKNITNVNAYTPASEEAQRDFIKSTRATYDQLKHAPVTLQNIEQAKALIPQARGFMGPGGQGMLEAAKFLNNRFGMNINTEGVKSAEELQTRLFMGVLENLKKMDSQPSQMQQQLLQDALGRIGTDPNALPAVLDVMGEAVKEKVTLHNREVSSAIQRGVKFPYDPLIELRRIPGGGGGGGGGGGVVDFNSLPQRR